MSGQPTLSLRNGDRNDHLLYLARQAVFFQYCCQFFDNQAAGSGVDGWSAYFEAETGKRYRTDPFTAAKQDNGDGGLSCLQLDTDDDGTAVCHVRIVAGVLYNCAQGGVIHPFGSGDREYDLFSGRERDATCGLYRLAQKSD